MARCASRARLRTAPARLREGGPDLDDHDYPSFEASDDLGTGCRAVQWSGSGWSGRGGVMAVLGESRCATPGPDDDLDFDPGDNMQAVVDAPNVNVLIGYAGADGRTVTIHAFTRQETDNVRGTTNDCGFFGVAQVAG